jgi:hypothetical protein
VEGILARKKNLFRLVLSVDMLAQSVAVEIDASDVEPVIGRGSLNVLATEQLAGLGMLPNPMALGRPQ